jgi:hypothetical protein
MCMFYVIRDWLDDGFLSERISKYRALPLRVATHTWHFQWIRWTGDEEQTRDLNCVAILNSYLSNWTTPSRTSAFRL